MYFEIKDSKSLELVTTRFELGAVASAVLLGLMSLLVAGSLVAGMVIVAAMFTAVVTVSALRYI
jgi:sugar phosphate permease